MCYAHIYIFQINCYDLLMEIEFSDPAYARLEVDGAFTFGFSAGIVSLYRKRIALIRSAPDERDFYALKSLHFEKLQGDRKGQHSMRLNDQWRLIIKFKTLESGKSVVVISIVDYHK